MSSSHVLNDCPPSPARSAGHLALAGFLMLAALLAGLAVTGVFSPMIARLLDAEPAAGVTNPYAPHELVIRSAESSATLAARIRARTGIAVTISGQPTAVSGEKILRLPHAMSVTAAAAKIEKLPGISYAVPNYIAHAAGSWVPDDPGISGKARGWEKLQWNFMPADGVDAPQAWANLIADHRPGARGVVIAVLDSGVAYRNWGSFMQSPDFAGTRFVAPCDLIAGTLDGDRCTNPYALDRLGHGTFVAGTIAEATNNGVGVTGLAYNASIMPVRVLNATGAGTASTIAAGVRYAVKHGARVINLSVEFPPDTTAAQIPELISAIAFAYEHGVVVVAAAGNDYTDEIDYPAADPDAIAVGATTADMCLASYSNTGRGLALVAPGGGDDSAMMRTTNCHPSRNLPDVYQMTFPNSANGADAVNVDAFVLQNGWFGTSMAAPDVSAAAAMVIASGVLGAHPTPAAILARLEATARHITGLVPNDDYGYGLLDIGAATAKGGPLMPTTTTSTSPTTSTTTTSPTSTTPTVTSVAPAART